MNAERERLCDLLREPPSAAAPITPALIAVAREEGVHLLLADRLHVPALDDDRRAAAAIGAAREVELRTVLAALAEAGARPILIKGAALAYTHYRRPELRPRDDTDMMIPAADREAVTRALAPLGYQRPPEADGELIIAQLHFDKHDRFGILHALDVHWRISNVRMFAGALTYEELACDAVPIPALGPHARGASARHSLLVACVHRVAHHADTRNLLWLYDIHLLARGGDAEPAAFAALASARGMREVCARGLTLAAEAFGGIDPQWIAALSAPSRRGASGGPGGNDEPSAAFLGGRLSLADILKANLAATPGWTARVRLVCQHLFPQRAFIYERYGTRQPAALPFLYVHRIVSGVPKWFRR
jgi:Uncharacterised nucleotidyltransferase